MELGELIDEHFEFAFRPHGEDIAIGVPVSPISELPWLARGHAHAGYSHITRTNYRPVVSNNGSPRK